MNPSRRCATRGLRIEGLKDHWALVSGASSGIGREFAQQLAALGMNLVLVARRASRLDVLATELSSLYGVQARALRMDLAQAGAAQQVRQRLQEADIRIRLLVNSAALGRWARFDASPANHYEEMIAVNAAALVSLCREFLPDLAQHPSSAVINISSPAAFQPMPNMAVYAATKAFVHSFSQGIGEEWREHGTVVQTLVPGPMLTELEGAKAGTDHGASQHLSDPHDSVRAAIAHLERGSAVVICAKGSFWQRLFALMPSRLVTRTVARMFSPPSER